MQCQACGYRLAPKWIAGLRAWSRATKTKPAAFPCDGCGRPLELVPGALSENGVGPDRLVPVENAQEGR